MRLPGFFGFGIQKGVTTALHVWLAKHPQVHLSNPKELHCFSHHFNRGLSWYCNHFAEVPQRWSCGEITLYYIFLLLAPERIAAAISRAKLIVLLCDPVERSLSKYFHSLHLGLETFFGLDDALASEADQLADSDSTWAKAAPHLSNHQHRYLCRNRYEQQLPRFKSFFLNVEKSWMQLLDFLRLEPPAMSDLPHAYAGGGEAKHVDDGLRQAFADQFAPTFRWVEQIYGFVWPLSVGL